MSFFKIVKNLFSDRSDRPLGNMTYDEAAEYFTRYCQLLEEGVGLSERESRLPTSIEQMKEAIKVEALRWCNQGKDFDDVANFMAAGFMRLASFLPDQLADRASVPERFSDLDAQEMEAFAKASRVASDVSAERMRGLNADWNEFLIMHREKYS